MSTSSAPIPAASGSVGCGARGGLKLSGGPTSAGTPTGVIGGPQGVIEEVMETAGERICQPRRAEGWPTERRRLKTGDVNAGGVTSGGVDVSDASSCR